MTPRTAARQASLAFTIFQSSLKLVSIQSVMPSNHLVLCRPLLLPSIFPSIRVFSSESALHLRWPKCWSFSISHGSLLYLLQQFSSIKSCLDCSGLGIRTCLFSHSLPSNGREMPHCASLSHNHTSLHRPPPLNPHLETRSCFPHCAYPHPRW